MGTTFTIRPRLILTHSEKCNYNCTDCYYTWRQHDTNVKAGILKSILIGCKDIDRVAIGINPGYHDHDMELLELAVDMGHDVVVTMPPAAVPHVPLHLLDKVSLISISMGCVPDSIHKISSQVSAILRKVEAPVAVSIVIGIPSNHAIMSIEESGIDPYFIYLLLRKGPPDMGWHMLGRTISSYVKDMEEMKKMTSIPVIPDECVWGILCGDGGNCMGEWIEVNSYGEVRLCPYTAQPYRVITSHKNLDNIIAQLNHIGDANRGDVPYKCTVKGVYL